MATKAKSHEENERPIARLELVAVVEVFIVYKYVIQTRRCEYNMDKTIGFVYNTVPAHEGSQAGSVCP